MIINLKFLLKNGLALKELKGCSIFDRSQYKTLNDDYVLNTNNLILI